MIISPDSLNENMNMMMNSLPKIHRIKPERVRFGPWHEAVNSNDKMTFDMVDLDGAMSIIWEEMVSR